MSHLTHLHKHETWYTGTDKRHGTQAQTRDMVHRHRKKEKNDAKAYKQGDMIYIGTYRDMEHTFTCKDMEPTYTNKETQYTQAHAETWNTLQQTGDIEHMPRQKEK